jgi:hypothetical protein
MGNLFGIIMIALLGIIVVLYYWASFLVAGIFLSILFAPFIVSLTLLCGTDMSGINCIGVCIVLIPVCWIPLRFLIKPLDRIDTWWENKRNILRNKSFGNE